MPYLSVDEMRKRVMLMGQVFGSLLDNWDKLSNEAKTQIHTGINKAFGQSEAAMHEYYTLVRQSGKGRYTETQQKGDVTVGKAADLFAKTIECKSVTAPTTDAVDSQIKDALNQLAGKTGHQPRDTDVRVVDVRIACEYNSWPFTGGAYGKAREAKSEVDFVKEAREKVKSLVVANQDIKAWLLGQAPQQGNLVRLRTIDKNTPQSSRPLVFDAAKNTTSILRCVTVKIRLDPGYPMLGAPFGKHYEASEVLLQALPVNGQVEVHAVKLKRWEWDMMTDLITAKKDWLA